MKVLLDCRTSSLKYKDSADYFLNSLEISFIFNIKLNDLAAKEKKKKLQQFAEKMVVEFFLGKHDKFSLIILFELDSHFKLGLVNTIELFQTYIVNVLSANGIDPNFSKALFLYDSITRDLSGEPDDLKHKDMWYFDRHGHQQIDEYGIDSNDFATIDLKKVLISDEINLSIDKLPDDKNKKIINTYFDEVIIKFNNICRVKLEQVLDDTTPIDSDKREQLKTRIHAIEGNFSARINNKRKSGSMEFFNDFKPSRDILAPVLNDTFSFDAYARNNKWLVFRLEKEDYPQSLHEFGLVFIFTILFKLIEPLKRKYGCFEIASLAHEDKRISYFLHTTKKKLNEELSKVEKKLQSLIKNNPDILINKNESKCDISGNNFEYIKISKPPEIGFHYETNSNKIWDEYLNDFVKSIKKAELSQEEKWSELRDRINSEISEQSASLVSTVNSRSDVKKTESSSNHFYSTNKNKIEITLNSFKTDLNVFLSQKMRKKYWHYLILGCFLVLIVPYILIQSLHHSFLFFPIIFSLLAVLSTILIMYFLWNRDKSQLLIELNEGRFNSSGDKTMQGLFDIAADFKDYVKDNTSSIKQWCMLIYKTINQEQVEHQENQHRQQQHELISQKKQLLDDISRIDRVINVLPKVTNEAKPDDNILYLNLIGANDQLSSKVWSNIHIVIDEAYVLNRED